MPLLQQSCTLKGPGLMNSWKIPARSIRCYLADSVFLAYLEVETQNFVVSFLKIELELAGGKKFSVERGINSQH